MPFLRPSGVGGGGGGNGLNGQFMSQTGVQSRFLGASGDFGIEEGAEPSYLAMPDAEQAERLNGFLTSRKGAAGGDAAHLANTSV